MVSAISGAAMPMVIPAATALDNMAARLKRRCPGVRVSAIIDTLYRRRRAAPTSPLLARVTATDGACREAGDTYLSCMKPSLAIVAGLAIALGACDSLPPPSGDCAFVELEHLARPRDSSGSTLICNPRRVSPAYVDRYFPGFEWSSGSS
ncbi:MAG: hypothetical protein HKM95_13805 [Inquilinus sp.]|nr:hypothetical protein [Inquilinus sp.]